MSENGTRDILKEGYKDPTKYDEAKKIYRTVPRRSYYHMLDFKRPNQIIMNFGCGHGPDNAPLLELIQGTGSKLIGLDISRESIRIGQEGNTNPDVTYVCADILKDTLPVPDGTLDIIVSNNALHHLPDWRGALGQFLKLLKPGGRIGITMNTEPNLSKLIRRLKQNENLAPYVQALSVMEWVDEPRGTAGTLYRKALDSLGFELQWIEEYYLKEDTEPEKLDIRADFFISVIPVSSAIPPHLRQEYRQVFLDSFPHWPSTEKIAIIATKPE